VNGDLLSLVWWSEAVKARSHLAWSHVAVSRNLAVCGSWSRHDVVALPVFFLICQTRHHVDQIHSTGTVCSSFRFYCSFFQIFVLFLIMFLYCLFRSAF